MNRHLQGIIYKYKNTAIIHINISWKQEVPAWDT